MAAKKAAKKAHKKAAKKHSNHKHHEHEVEKDLRRAYEHLGRLETLRSGLPKSALSQIEVLTEMARTGLLAGEAEGAADLLRACEHLAFAALASSAAEDVGEALRDAIVAQYERLLERAVERWDEHETEPGAALTGVYEATFTGAESAYSKKAYRKALELVRAAESLAHVSMPSSLSLDSGRTPRKLKR